MFPPGYSWRGCRVAGKDLQENFYQRQRAIALVLIAVVLVASLRLGNVEWRPIILIAVFVPMIVLAVRHGQKPQIDAQRALEHQATHDMLTGLPNRVLFQRRLKEARRNALGRGTGFALVLVDLDGFKAVNDEHGHLAGDALLQVVASRLRSNLRVCDIVARFGGDEFAMILENVSDKEVLSERGQQLRSILAEPYTLIGRQGQFIAHLSASIGIALGIGEGGDWLIQAADQALYMAKAAGKNGCVVTDGLIAEKSSPDATMAERPLIEVR